MLKITPLVVALLFAFPALSHAAASGTSSQGVDDGLAAGLDMMLINTSMMRNGDDVWQRAREGFQLAEVNPELVRRHEQYFASRPEYLRRTLDRSRKYLFFIMNEVEKRGMPTELAFLPVVESSFLATARSPVGAEGLWQFMPATGREYQLEQTWWYDGRRDVIESTRAALDYLQVLYNRFGDWNLALAAYNWGQGNLNKAITRVRAKGEVETYENVTMPTETRNYAPKLLAIRNIMAKPERFGLRIDMLPNKPTFVSINTGKHMNIDIAAKLAEMSVPEFKELNPAFNLPVYAHKSGRQMLLPANKLHRFETNLAKWEKPLLTWQVHIPSANENVTDIARNFNMNTNELITANSLQGSREISAGRPVLVAAARTQEVALESTDIAQTIPSDTIVAVADTTPETPAMRAKATPAAQRPATTVAPVLITTASTIATPVTQSPLIVSAAATQPVALSVADKPISHTPAPRPITAVKQAAPVAVPQLANLTSEPALPLRPATRLESHIVSSGDTLYNISRRYGMTVEELKRLNTLGSDSVKLGQNLHVLGAPVSITAQQSLSPSPLRTVAYQAATTRKQNEYIVQTGDTVFSIARKFGILHSDLQRWNEQLTSSQIRPGQVLRLEDSGL